MTLLPADCVLIGVTCILAVMGLFRGFSGALAFVCASAAACVAAMFCWSCSATFTVVSWQRGVGTLLAALVTFGLVRVVVRKCVNGLLAQPADSLLGLLFGVLTVLMAVVALAKVGIGAEYSEIVRRVSPFVQATETDAALQSAAEGGDA